MKKRGISRIVAWEETFTLSLHKESWFAHGGTSSFKNFIEVKEIEMKTLRSEIVIMCNPRKKTEEGPSL